MKLFKVFHHINIPYHYLFQYILLSLYAINEVNLICSLCFYYQFSSPLLSYFFKQTKCRLSDLQINLTKKPDHFLLLILTYPSLSTSTLSVFLSILQYPTC